MLVRSVSSRSGTAVASRAGWPVGGSVAGDQTGHRAGQLADRGCQCRVRQVEAEQNADAGVPGPQSGPAAEHRDRCGQEEQRRDGQNQVITSLHSNRAAWALQVVADAVVVSLSACPARARPALGACLAAGLGQRAAATATAAGQASGTGPSPTR